MTCSGRTLTPGLIDMPASTNDQVALSSVSGSENSNRKGSDGLEGHRQHQEEKQYGQAREPLEPRALLFAGVDFHHAAGWAVQLPSVRRG